MNKKLTHIRELEYVKGYTCMYCKNGECHGPYLAANECESKSADNEHCDRKGGWVQASNDIYRPGWLVETLPGKMTRS